MKVIIGGTCDSIIRHPCVPRHPGWEPLPQGIITKLLTLISGVSNIIIKMEDTHSSPENPLLLLQEWLKEQSKSLNFYAGKTFDSLPYLNVWTEASSSKLGYLPFFFRLIGIHLKDSLFRLTLISFQGNEIEHFQVSFHFEAFYTSRTLKARAFLINMFMVWISPSNCFSQVWRRRRDSNLYMRSISWQLDQGGKNTWATSGPPMTICIFDLNCACEKHMKALCGPPLSLNRFYLFKIVFRICEMI